MADEPLIVLAGVVALFVVIFCCQGYTRAPPPKEATTHDLETVHPVIIV